ncbi:opacity family porin [Ekhidna sp.]
MTESNVVVPLLKKVGLVIMLFVTTTKGVGQEVEIVNQPKRMTPFVVVIYDNEQTDFVDDNIREYKASSFLLIKVANQSIESLKDTINNRLNYTDRIDLQRCYLLLIGDQQLFDKYHRLGNSLLFSSRYFLTDGQSVAAPNFMVGGLGTVKVSKVIADLKQNYLWQIRLEQIEEENVSDLNQNAIETGMGIRVSGVRPFYDGIETNIKPFFRTFSLNIYHRWSRRWQTNLDATIGLNLPSQNKIQREIQSVGFSDDEVEITIQAHVLASAGLETRYLFLPENRKLNPYVGIRLGVSSIDATETTIEVDPGDISSGGFERPDSFSPEDFESIRSPTIGISSGLQYNMSPRLMIETGLRWSNDLKNITEVAEPYFNNLSLSVGFNFRFTGRKKLFYNYMNLRSGE